MGRVIKFYGRSDDLFEIEDSANTAYLDEIGAYNRTIAVKVFNQFGGLYVIASYAVHGTGTWAIGVAPLDEDVPFPDWEYKLRFEGYSAVLSLTVPDDVDVNYA